MDNEYNFSPQRQVPVSPYKIFVNQLGYLPQSVKKAVIPFKCSSFCVEDMNGGKVLSGVPRCFGFDPASGDNVYSADFSALTAEGKYRITADGNYSASFEICDSVYSKLTYDTARAFYFLRCGCGLDSSLAGEYAHPPCHTEMALLWNDNSVSLDVSGGWHDAGDYGRYVTAGACALGHLLYAYKMFPKAADISLNIPKSGSRIPDLLNECKTELLWLLKMQRADGAVYHKATTALHAPFIMPEQDKEQMYVFPPSSMATADFAAICALAAGIYREYDPEFALRLERAAKLSYDRLKANPEFTGFENPKGCNTGSYGQRDDISNRFWAAAEMYSLTGEGSFLKDAIAYLQRNIDLCGLGYGDMGGLGSLSLLTGGREIPHDVRERLTAEFCRRAAHLARLSDRCGYSVAMGEKDYHWGSNMEVLKRGMIFLISDRISGESKYREYAMRQLHYICGVNAVGTCYVTGNGDFCCNYPHLRPAYADGIEKCIPGMVSGGANGRPCDEEARRLIPAGTYPMKCYADDVACYSLNEITIYWNSPMVFLLLGIGESSSAK